MPCMREAQASIPGVTKGLERRLGYSIMGLACRSPGLGLGYHMVPWTLSSVTVSKRPGLFPRHPWEWPGNPKLNKHVRRQPYFQCEVTEGGEPSFWVLRRRRRRLPLTLTMPGSPQLGKEGARSWVHTVHVGLESWHEVKSNSQHHVALRSSPCW